MKLFSFNKKNEEVTKVTKEDNNVFDGIFNLSTQTSLPIIKERNNQEWVSYLTDDGEQYITYLEKLYNNSPTHQAIVDTKSLMINGAELVYDAPTDFKSKIELERIISFADGVNDLHTITGNLIKDNQLYGSMAIEIIWSNDFTRINKINRISPKYIRSGKFINGKVKTYYYSRDWDNRREEVSEISAFDITNKKDHRQLLYVPNQVISNEYYGEASYLASCNWINLEAQTGLFYKSLMENGFNPSLIVKYYKKNSTLEERDTIVQGLKRSFGGVKNTGKIMAIFASDKDNAPDIEPINVSQLDKQFTVIADQIVTKILTGARVTTSELFGISIAGKLGTADFDTQVKAFATYVIRPEQKKLELILNKLLKINGLSVNLTIKPLDI